MKYRIVEKDKRFYPERGGWIFWNPLMDLMNEPASFGTRYGATVFIQRAHCNWLNNTTERRIKWGRSITPKVLN